MEFDKYSREERALCSHLFRLLHEKLADYPLESGLSKFIKLLSNKNIEWKGTDCVPDLSHLKFRNAAILTEVAIIRDKYESLKPNVHSFMDQLTGMVMKQEKVLNCRLYSKLPKELCDPFKTHPKQIRWKAKYQNIDLSQDEYRVYGAIQGMFNAKPDIAIIVDNCLISVEVKFTLRFDGIQLDRTTKITGIWASDLLRKDFGFSSEPVYTVIKLGPSRLNSDINWSEIMEIAKCFYPENDRTYASMMSAILLLKKLGRE